MSSPIAAPAETLVVRPTLHELPPDAVAAVCRRPLVNDFVESLAGAAALAVPRVRRALATRASLLERHGNGSLHVLADLSGGADARLVALSRDELTELEGCRLDPGRLALLRSSDPGLFERFLRAGLLVTEDEALRSVRPTHVEIEINRHCNWRCVFCPVSEKPKEPQLMEEELFLLLLERVVDYGARSLALHFYGEPLMHPKALDWIERAVAAGLRVELFTNGSLLDEAKIRRLAALRNTSLHINLPSLDADEFARVTGTKLFARCVENLEQAHAHALPVSLVINAPRETGQATVDRINEVFAARFGPSVLWRTNDRAGHLDAPAYASPSSLSGRLSGCTVLLNQIVVSYAGKVIPCCQDYDQQWEWGDLTRDSLVDVLESEPALAFKRQVLGLEPAPESSLCSQCDLTGALGATEHVFKVGRDVEPPLLADVDARLFLGARFQEL